MYLLYICSGFPLHGNPGDYAWGPGGLDNIVTQVFEIKSSNHSFFVTSSSLSFQLLNQIEGGVPPMTEVKIKKIPTVKITQKQVGKRN